MQNKIFHVSKSEMLEIKQNLQKDSSLFIAEINSDEVTQLDDFLAVISEVFDFPYPSGSLNSFSDWIRDLDWLEKDGYVLIFYSSKDFLCQDTQAKNRIIEYFEEVILPWWQADVERCVVEGKAKPFNVYFVD